MAEFRRRRDAGIAEPTVKGEAMHLESYMKQRFPSAPGSDSKTIENNIRDEHREWRASLAAPTRGKVRK
jgi:hypothetical protein